MPKLAKRILIFAAALVALAILGLLFLNLYVESAGTTVRIEHKLSAAIGMPVRITGTSFTPWSGLRMTGVTAPGGEGRPNFFEAAAFDARFEFGPLFRRQLVINRVTIEEPHISWAQDEKGRWRLPSKTEVRPKESESPSRSKPEHAPRVERVTPFIISVQRLRVQSGRFDFLDAQQRPMFGFAGVNMDSPRAEGNHLEGALACESIVFRGDPVLQNLKTPVSYEKGEEGTLKFPEISATLGGGELTGNFTIQPEKTGSPFSQTAKFQHVDLNQLVAALGGMPGQAAGQAEGNLKLEGNWRDSDTIHGEGHLQVANGMFKQYEFLQLLGQVLQIEELSQLTLQHAEADCHVADGRIAVDRLELQSPNLKLSATGKIKFNGKLDLAARLTINERLSRQLPQRIEANFTPAANAGERYVDFDVAGTLDKPRTNLQQKILGKSYESQAINVLKSLFGGAGGQKKEGKAKGEKRKIELAPAASPTPMIPDVKLPPVPEPNATPEPATLE